MKYIYLAILAGLMAGCAKPAPIVVDPVLAPYFASFSQNIGVDTSGISAGFANTETTPNPLGEVIGECNSYSDGTRTIQIDSDFWANATDDQREQVMYHELSHCSMYIGHTPGYIIGGPMNNCPTSIMNPYVFGNAIDCYTNNKAYYYKELRSHG